MDEEREEGKLSFFYYFFATSACARDALQPITNGPANGAERGGQTSEVLIRAAQQRMEHTTTKGKSYAKTHTHKDDDCPVKYPVAGGLSVLNELKIELSLPNPFHRSSNPIRKSN